MARIVLADDDEGLRVLIAGTLRDSGFEVVEVGDGQAALDAIAKQRPDLLVLDMAMAPLDGYTVATRLRDDPKLSSLPVVVITGRGQLQSFLHEHGNVKAFIEKPFSPAHVLAIVSGLLKNS